MGRTISFDAEVQENLNTIIKSKHVHTGLIIGQRTIQKDIAIRLCPTPQKEADKEVELSPSEATKKKKKDSRNSDESSYELDEFWICQHVKQATRALPGGFEVLGLYIAAPTDLVNTLQPKLRQVIFAIYKKLSKDQKLSVNSHITDRVLLHICTVSFKCVCRTYDVSDYKSTANPADWKPLSGTPRWHKMQARLAVDLKFAIKSEGSNFTLQKQIESSLAPFFKNIMNSFPLINNVHRELEEPLDTSIEGKKSKQKNLPSQQCYDIELLIPLEQNDNVPQSQTSDCSVMLTFKGTVQCRAFVHGKATVKETIQAIKQDIIRSITARSEIHCEDLLVIDGEQQDPIVVYELPKRVFAPLPQSDICVCDYQFHGDSASDSLEAFKELLNLELTEQDVETSCEISPTTSALIQPEAMEDRLSEFGDHPPADRNLLYPVASAAIAAVAAGLSYFFLLQEP